MHEIDRFNPRGLGSARAASLPPDGLLCNYTTHLCHGQRLQGYEFCIRLVIEHVKAHYGVLLPGTFWRTKLLPTNLVPTQGRLADRWIFSTLKKTFVLSFF